MNTSYDPLYLFIDGKWLEADGRDTASVINPATQRELGRVPLATAADLDHAADLSPVPVFDLAEGGCFLWQALAGTSDAA